MKKRMVIIASLALITLIADQATKVWARKTLKGTPGITLISGYLDFEYHENPGSAFGMFRDMPGARFVLTGVGIVALIFVWQVIRKVEHRQRMAAMAFGLIVGGAIGNVIDRIYIGRVVDFVVMHIHRKYIWPAYNVADVALVIGVGLLILVLGRKPEKRQPKKRQQQKRKKK